MVYILALLSSLMLLGSFEPLNFWWLSFVALAPFAYILYSKDRFSLRQSMIAGAIIATIFSAGMSFPTLTQFHWYELGKILVILMQLMWIPIILLAVLLGALASYAGRKLQDNSIRDVLLFGVIWTIIEMIRNSIFLNFDYGLLGYSMHAVPPIMEFASMGGVLSVSFILATINGFIGWVIFKKGIQADEIKKIIFSVAVIYIIYALNHSYLYDKNSIIKTISISSIQINTKESPFGKFNAQKDFILEERTQNMIKAAALQGPDYLIYPFNIVGGVLTDGSDSSIIGNLFSGTFDDLGKWLAEFLPEKTKFVMWTNTLRDNNQLSAEVNFWQKNSIVDFYQKREIFPFIDFTPASVQKFGIYTTPLDFNSGPKNQTVNIDGLSIGNLICSELNLPSLASYDSRKSDIIFAIGSAAVFRDQIIGDRNIILAQFRAVENNVPVVRSDRKGPSAIIDSRGRILSFLPFEKDGVLKYDLPIYKHKNTLYSAVGDWLIFALTAFIFLYQIFGKRFPVRT